MFLEKKGTKVACIKMVKEMYYYAVGTLTGLTKELPIAMIDMRERPCLLALFMEELTMHIQEIILWCRLFQMISFQQMRCKKYRA